MHDDGALPAAAPASAALGEVERALAVGAPERVGWFIYSFANECWEWSARVQRMYGYEPGTVAPTTTLVLAHQPSDDYLQIPDTLELVRRTGQAFSSRHRIRDVQGRIHRVIVVADQLRDDTRTVVGIHGFYIDITRDELERRNQLNAVASNCAAIEQAKGMLMLVYGVDALTACELLRWRSQKTGVRLRDLAEQIAGDFHRARNRDTIVLPQSTYDHLLLTAHLRIGQKRSQVQDFQR
jgi:hypothetical protein